MEASFYTSVFLCIVTQAAWIGDAECLLAEIGQHGVRAMVMCLVVMCACWESLSQGIREPLLNADYVHLCFCFQVVPAQCCSLLAASDVLHLV